MLKYLEESIAMTTIYFDTHQKINGLMDGEMTRHVTKYIIM